MHSDLVYRLSLTRVQYIGYVHAKILAQHFPTAKAIFEAKKSELERIEGIGEIRARSIKQFTTFKDSESEISFIEQYNIQPLFLTDADYPQRLLHCYDPPTMLFYKGNADLNAPKTVAVVGTRNNTDYGRQITEKLVKELSELPVTIISGLAFGIDAIAHKAALKNGLPTIGVVGHGLDTIYPSEHANLAKTMLKNGGLLTEFTSGTKPDKHNFPSRNRVVAGISDATILVETGIKGGSMITGELGNSYNRDVFAVPGRTIDTKSAGCNFLIKSNKAVLLSSASELIEMMGWNDKPGKQRKVQKELFIELSAEEQVIVNMLTEKENIAIDEINMRSGLSSSAVASAILNLELKNVVQSLPGKRYRLL